jgi:hypothetical protein
MFTTNLPLLLHYFNKNVVSRQESAYVLNLKTAMSYGYVQHLDPYRKVECGGLCYDTMQCEGYMWLKFTDIRAYIHTYIYRSCVRKVFISC